MRAMPLRCALVAASLLVTSGAAAAEAPDPIFAAPGALSSAGPAFRGPTEPRDEASVTTSPRGLVFAAARDREEASAPLQLHNGTDQALEVRAIELAGDGAAHFRLRDLPALPARIAARSSLTVTVAFAPGPAAPVAVYKALVRFRTSRSPREGTTAGLSALAFAGAAGSEAEPPLQAIVDALGLGVDVGGRQQILGNGTAPLGDEISAPLFQRAGAGPVLLIPLACFAVKGLSFGHYLPPAAGAVQPRVAGTFVVGQNKHLRPRLEPQSQTAFEIPERQAFGIWLQGANRALKFFTEDRRNQDGAHRTRVYPLRLEKGAVPHAFLIAFENWTNWDYQDALFVLWNADPAGSGRVPGKP
jgi:hypothetical protein